MRDLLHCLPLVALLGCRPPTSGGTGSATTSASAGSDGESSGTTDACMNSGECDTEGICVADYTPPQGGPAGGARGPAVCAEQTACIPALDLTRWCFDHQSCCDDLRCRSADGVCEEPGLGVSTGEDPTGTTADTGTSGSTGSGSDSTGGSSGGSSASGSASSGSASGSSGSGG